MKQKIMIAFAIAAIALLFIAALPCISADDDAPAPAKESLLARLLRLIKGVFSFKDKVYGNVSKSSARKADPPEGFDKPYDMENRMKDPEWIKKHYTICDVDCYVPEPLKGKELNDYFKSLNLTEKYIYAMMQFDVLGATPSKKQIKKLKRKGVVFIEEGYPCIVKVPKKFLEEKSYDFIRWIGIISPEGKLIESYRKQLWGRNCTGRVGLRLLFYENLNNEQFEKIRQVTGEQAIRYPNNQKYLNIEFDVTKLNDVAQLDFVKRITCDSKPSIRMPGISKLVKFNSSNNSIPKDESKIIHFSFPHLNCTD